MTVSVDFDALRNACEWVSGGDALAIGCEAYVSRAAGTVHWQGEGVDAALPADIGDGSLYITVPRKRDMDLGRALVFRFVDEHLAHARETVGAFFGKRGAYARYKSLLERQGQLDAWHAYEEVALEEALRAWCEENGFVLARTRG